MSKNMKSNGKKRPSESQFLFKNKSDFQDAKKHKVNSYEVVPYDFPIKPDSDQTIVEKHITSKKMWACNQKFRFRIGGVFEKRAQGEVDWTSLVLDDCKDVIIEPGWFESQISNFLILNGQQIVVTKSEGKYVNSVLNSFLHSRMTKEQKKMLCIHRSNPAFCAPRHINDWMLYKAAVPAHDDVPEVPEVGAAWRKYAKDVFVGGSYEFDYIPLHAAPFFQGCNYFVGEDMPNIWPMALFKNGLTFRFNFVDHLDYIFKVRLPAANTKYRFRYESIQLIVEEMNLPHEVFNKIMKNTSTLCFRGVTRILKLAEVPHGNRNHIIAFNPGEMPEGVFAFALPKERSSGAWKYQNNVDGNVFNKHLVIGLKITWGGRQLYIAVPNISDLSSDSMKQKLYFDYLTDPPFGLKWDPSLVEWETILGENTPYPHIYASLTNFGDKSRVVPFMDQASTVLKDNELGVELLFESENGAPEGVSYYCYAYHTDINLKYNPNTQIFSNDYFVMN